MLSSSLGQVPDAGVTVATTGTLALARSMAFGGTADYVDAALVGAMSGLGEYIGEATGNAAFGAGQMNVRYLRTAGAGAGPLVYRMFYAGGSLNDSLLDAGVGVAGHIASQYLKYGSAQGLGIGPLIL